MGKIIRLTVIYAAVALAVWFFILFYLNGTVVFADPGPAGSAAISQSTGRPTEKSVRITGIPTDAQNIAFSYDGVYCTYMQGSQLFVRDIATGTTVKTITGNVSQPVLMRDRNILLYFTEGSGFALNTYNIDSGQETRQAVFAGEAGARVKAVDYSNQTNLVYVNFAKLKGGAEADAVYSVNIMKTIRKAPFRLADNMVLLGGTDALYYNGPNNSLYENSRLLGGRGKLIGRDAQDRIYVQSQTDSRTVFIYQMKKLAGTVTLPAGSVRFYANQKSVYAVYGGYMVNLAGNTKISFDSSLVFLGMGGETAYFRQTDGSITSIKTTI